MRLAALALVAMLVAACGRAARAPRRGGDASARDARTVTSQRAVDAGPPAFVAPPAREPAALPYQLDGVLLIGSSSVNGALGFRMEYELAKRHLYLQKRGVPNTGLARPDYFDWHAEIGRLGELSVLRGVIVYLGGNDAQAFRVRDEDLPEGATDRDRWIQFHETALWRGSYVARARAFVEALCAAGAPKVIVLLPLDGEVSTNAPRIRRIQAMQREATVGTRCGVVAEASAVDLDAERAGDGVHINALGARAVWRAIETPILGALGVFGRESSRPTP